MIEIFQFKNLETHRKDNYVIDGELMRYKCTQMEKFEAPFLYGVTFYPNTASNYIISIILRCFMNK